MITNDEAVVIANLYLDELQRETGDPLLLTNTQEESFGWVFSYQSKDYMETGSLSSMLAGNAPFIVTRRDGVIHVLGTVHPVDVYIKEYAQLQS